MDHSSIIRTQKGRSKPFTITPNAVFADTRLSLKAKGLLGYLLSKPDGWQVQINHLLTIGPDGKESLQSGLRELEAFGYLVRTRARAPNGQFQWVSTIYEEPENMDTGPMPFDAAISNGTSAATGKAHHGTSAATGLAVDGLTIDGKARHIVNTELVNTDQEKTEGRALTSPDFDQPSTATNGRAVSRSKPSPNNKGRDSPASRLPWLAEDAYSEYGGMAILVPLDYAPPEAMLTWFEGECKRKKIPANYYDNEQLLDHFIGYYRTELDQHGNLFVSKNWHGMYYRWLQNKIRWYVVDSADKEPRQRRRAQAEQAQTIASDATKYNQPGGKYYAIFNRSNEDGPRD